MDEAATPDLAVPTRRLMSGLYVPENLGDTDLDTTAPIDVVDRRPAPEPQNQPVVPPPTPTPPPAPAPPSAPVPTADPEQTADPTAAPVSAAAPAPVAPAPVVELPQPTPRPVKPERPALVAPKMPEKPDLDRVEKTGHYASVTGYVLSVGVGAFGQIMFLGNWLEATLPAPGNWVAAAIGAAFAEIGMIGAGNSSLAKRKDGGRWKLLFAVACFVCFGAVTMQVAHWWPKGFGVALVFGLASFVGFLIHMTIEHSKIRDYEDRVEEYEKAEKAYRAEQQARYEQDLVAYDAAVAEQQRQRRQVEQAAKKAAEPVEALPQPSAAKASTKTAGGRATKADALRVGIGQKVCTPAKLREALVDAGYALPASSTTVENWCKDIKAELSDAT